MRNKKINKEAYIMSVEYEAFVGRGFMFGENNVPSFKEYCERVKIDPYEAFEIFQDEDLVISDCYGYDWLDHIFFGEFKRLVRPYSGPHIEWKRAHPGTKRGLSGVCSA